MKMKKLMTPKFKFPEMRPGMARKIEAPKMAAPKGQTKAGVQTKIKIPKLIDSRSGGGATRRGYAG